MKKAVLCLACMASLFFAVSCSDESDDLDLTIHNISDTTEHYSYGSLSMAVETSDTYGNATRYAYGNLAEINWTTVNDSSVKSNARTYTLYPNLSNNTYGIPASFTIKKVGDEYYMYSASDGSYQHIDVSGSLEGSFSIDNLYINFSVISSGSSYPSYTYYTIKSIRFDRL